MSIIKPKRGTGSPAGSIVANEIAMDTASRTLYTSTDGSDAVIIGNDTQYFLENNTISGITTETTNYYDISKFSRIDSGANYTVSCLEVERDYGSSDPATGLDDRGAGFTFTVKSDNYSDIYPGAFYGKSGGKDQSAGVTNVVGMSTYGGAADSYAEYTILEGDKNQLEVRPRLKALDGADIEDPDADLNDAVVNIKVDQSGYNRPQLMLEDSNGKAFSMIGEMDNVNQMRDKFIVTLDPDNVNSPTNITSFAGDYGIYYLKEYGTINNPSIEMNVFGAKDAFKLRIYDDANSSDGGASGSPSPGPLGNYGGYGWKPFEAHCENFQVHAKDSDTSTEKVLEVDIAEAIFEVPIRNANLSADPANPVNGWQYYNTTTHKLRLYANGAWVDLN